MYTDETVLTKGRYKKMKLAEVPAIYFLNIYNNSSGADPELLEYIENNIQRLQNLAPPPSPKKVYLTEEEKLKATQLKNIIKCKHPGCTESHTFIYNNVTEYQAGSLERISWTCSLHPNYVQPSGPKPLDLNEKMETSYTDNTILTKGEHKFTALCRVDPEYLIRIYEARNRTDQDLFAYIHNNLLKIKDRRDGKIPTPDIGIGFKILKHTVMPVCQDSNKIMYPSEKEAKKEIQRIALVDTTNKKPVRSYSCQYCGAWHLTSTELEDFDTEKINWPKFVKPRTVIHWMLKFIPEQKADMVKKLVSVSDSQDLNKDKWHQIYDILGENILEEDKGKEWSWEVLNLLLRSTIINNKYMRDERKTN